MNTVRTGWVLGVLGWIGLTWHLSHPPSAQARPNYKDTFAAHYPALSESVEKFKCGVCHPPTDNVKKTKRNNYGQALEKALGAKNVSDVETIKAALLKIEAEKTADGKTFGEVIKAGELPGKND